MNSLSLFEARAWLARKETGPLPLPKQEAYPKEHTGFAPQNFVIPEWTGDGLISKSALEIRTLVDDLTESMFQKFIERPSLTLRLEQMIYEEFVSFIASEEEKQKYTIDSAKEFWTLWRSHNKFFEKQMHDFFKYFSFKTVIIYLFKIRFLILLSETLNRPFNETNLINPNSFLEKFFPNGSSFELQCDSIANNVYSWFVPSPRFKKRISDLAHKIPKLSITELMKITAYTTDDKGSNFTDKEYSHSLSHKSFGFFMNELLVNFPRWMKQEGLKSSPRVLGCKFSGDNLSAIVLSHWLAQEEYLTKETTDYRNLLAPSFTNIDGEKTNYLKICQELEFLTFMTKYSKTNELDPVKVISEVMRSKTLQRGNEQQTAFLFNQVDPSTVMYDRIILNTASLPKTNTHYHLLRKIEKELPFLKADGHLYVLSTQQLFVLSRTEKLENLFEKIQLNAIFDFDELKGRGELAPYLYVFSKREDKKRKSLEALTASTQSRESFLNFRFRGTLTRFAYFSRFVKAINEFWSSKNSLAGPLYQKELGNDLEFQFYQNTIIGSRPLRSDLLDSDRVTHPNFLKKLTSTCVSMDHFFRIESLKQKEKNPIHEDGLFSSYEQGLADNAYLLILDYSHIENVSMELCSMQMYASKMEQYGTAFFEYFMLLPKVPDININLFKEFFEGPLGNQVVQLALSGNRTKLKAHLNTLLIPKFFLGPKILSDEQERPFSFLLSTDSELLSMGASHVANAFHELKNHIMQLGDEFPWHLLGLVSNFKRNVFACLQKFQTSKNKNLIRFDNPIIVESLRKLQTFKFYPNNKDVFIDFKTTTPSDLYMPLESTVMAKNDHDSSYYLTLKHGERAVISLHGSENILLFLDFLLARGIGTSILSLLTGIRIPDATALNHIIESFKEGENIFESLYTELADMVKQAFTKRLLR